MADMNSIEALLQALKSKESSGSLPSDDSDPGDDSDSSPEDEGSDDDTAEDNAKIVAALQTQYPNIFAKISKQIEADDSSDSGLDSGGDLSDVMSGMRGMVK